MTTVLIGYDLAPGLTPAEYDRWLYDVHLPDLLANPHLKRIVLNRVLEPVATTSDGSTALTQAVTLYRVAELHFEDVDGFRLYREWFNAHPIPQERGPAGRTDFKFYVLCDAETFTR